MKKLVGIILVFLLVVGTSGCQNPETKTENNQPVVMFLAGEGRIEDGSFNESILKGLKKGATELKYDLKAMPVEKGGSYEENIKVAVSQKPKIIVGIGQFVRPLLATADLNKDIHFVAIDASLSSEEANNLPANFIATSFDNAQGAFLMGVLAASASTTPAVGFIGGVDNEIVQSTDFGYQAGVKAVSAEKQTLSTIIDTFGDTAKAAQAATTQNQQGAGVIFGFAGGANLGIIENAAQSGYWFIGVDQDQALSYPQYAPSILCSMVKNVDVAAYESVKMILDGSFKSGIKSYGIGNGGIALGNAGGNITPELSLVYEKWQKLLADGTVTVPRTKEALDAFTAPVL